MNRFYWLIFVTGIFYSSATSAQSIPLLDCGLTYFYDASGNRVVRMIVPCQGGGTGRMRDTTETAKVSTGLSSDTVGDFQIVLISPNPTGGPFRVTCNENLANADVTIIDIQGRVVSETNVSGKEVSFDISHLAVGTYQVIVTTDHGRTGKNIVKNSQK